MPRPKKKVDKTYTEVFSTAGQRVSKSGTEVIMENGRRFKRTVLPSSADGLKTLRDGVDDIEDIEQNGQEDDG